MRPAVLVTAEGIAHGALCLWLYADGHAPSFVGWPVDPQHYYLLQGLALPLLMPALWWVACRIAGRIARVPTAQLKEPLARALALPTLLLLVLPDALAYALGGMPALTLAARFVGPLLLLTLLLSAGLSVHRVAPERGGIAGVCGLLVALFLGGLLIR
ncbi:MAG: hypothetical protein P8R54_15950 [Myxococcota bacterium]|nr:hypothetical protein [Myxococcota bacterium]